MTFTQRPITAEDQLWTWVQKNPHAKQIPDYLTRVIDQIERGEGVLDTSTINIKDYDIYQIEREIEHDTMAKSERHQIRQQLADYMEENIKGCPFNERLYSEYVERLRSARTTGAVGIDPVTGRHITAWDDKVNCVRLCPDEAREETQRLTRKYAPEIFRLLEANPDYRCFYAVYTSDNVPVGELSEGKRSIYKEFANFHRTSWAKDCIKGSFVIQEDPLAIDEKSWNVHLNVIHVVKGRFDYKEVRRRWGRNVEIKHIQGKPEAIAKAFLEVVKYAAKHIGEKSHDGHSKALGMTSWSWSQFHEWFMAGKGFRRSRSYGCLYRFEGIPDKGVALEDVIWCGSIAHDGTAYQVTLNKNDERLNGVDLIQADNFATRSLNRPLSHLDSPPPDRANI